MSRSSWHVPLRHRLTVRLTGGVILALLLIGCPFLLAFHRLLRNQQLDALAESAAGLSRVMVDSLSSAMLAGQPHLLDDAVRDLTKQEEIERVILLDHQGRVRVSSDQTYEGEVMDREREETCRACHQEGGGTAESRAAVSAIGDRRVLRAMSVIPNQPQCHGCHAPTTSINGILLMDLSMSSADQRFLSGIGSTVALGGVMVVLTIAVLVLLLRTMVHTPLQGVVTTSQRIVQGDLDARVGISSKGEFGLLGSQVNRMTDHLAHSLRTVETQRRDLQAVLDAIDDEIVVLDRDQRVVAGNKAFQDAVGRTQPEIEGRFCHDVSASHWPCVASEPGGCPVRKVFDTGQLHKGIVSRSDSQGKERTIEIHASPLRGKDVEVDHVVEVRRDISERRQMEATLAQSERLTSLGLLASGLSHEINNPLGAIGTSVEGLLRRVPSDSGLSPETTRDLEKTLQRIARDVERGRRITHGLLKVARTPGGIRSLVDVNHVIEEILLILSHDIKRSGIEARLELAETLPPLLGDESQLGQVIMNLVLNAVQAMDGEGGNLLIATSATNGSIRIEVEDTGCGVPPDLLKRIYEPFFTTKPIGKGTGLGLFIAHQIVSEMGGTIEARSKTARGTSFSVCVPTQPGGSESS
jgi:PAS domain S-box-containing protein